VVAYDNPYCEIVFDGYRAPSILQVPGARDVAIEFHSLSKTFGMTGWRLGWAVGGRHLIEALSKVKSYVDTGPFLAIQSAGAAVLDRAESIVPPIVQSFRVRRDAAVVALREAGLVVESPRATMYLWVMYLWVPVPRGVPSAEFAGRLLKEQGVLVVHGSAFGPGGEGFFRVALTVGPERLREAATRVAKGLAGLGVAGAEVAG
jgi:LL-diaminopimelate aminotransferase